MAAEIQNNCQQVLKFYKLVIKLSVYEFLQLDDHFYLMERWAIHNQYVFQCYNPIWRL